MNDVVGKLDFRREFNFFPVNSFHVGVRVEYLLQLQHTSLTWYGL